MFPSHKVILEASIEAQSIDLQKWMLPKSGETRKDMQKFVRTSIQKRIVKIFGVEQWRTQQFIQSKAAGQVHILRQYW